MSSHAVLWIRLWDLGGRTRRGNNSLLMSEQQELPAGVCEASCLSRVEALSLCFHRSKSLIAVLRVLILRNNKLNQTVGHSPGQQTNRYVFITLYHHGLHRCLWTFWSLVLLCNSVILLFFCTCSNSLAGLWIKTHWFWRKKINRIIVFTSKLRSICVKKRLLKQQINEPKELMSNVTKRQVLTSKFLEV